MTTPSDEDLAVPPPPPPLPSRRLRPAGRWLVGIWLLVPGLALAGTISLFALWHMPREEHLVRELSQGLERSRERERDLHASLQKLEARERECRREQARTSAAERRERSLRELTMPLLAALADKKIEEVPSDATVRAVLERASPELLDLSLIDNAGQQVFVRRGGAAGTLREALPELAAVYAPDRPSPPASQPGWHWFGVKGYNLQLAYRSQEEELPATTEPPLAPAPAEPAATAAASLSPALRPWHLMLAGAAALVLLLFAFVWINARVLRPLHELSQCSRDMLERPAQTAPIVPFESGPARELSLSLQRLQHAVHRLAEEDQAAEERKQSLQALVSLLEEVRRGELGQRIQDLCPEFSLLGSSLNRALEEVSGRMQAAREATQRMEDAARRLTSLAEAMAGRMEGPGAEAVADPTLLADALEVQLREIFASARALIAEGESSVSGAEPEPAGEGPLALAELRADVESLELAEQALQPFFSDLTGLSTTLAVAAQSGTTPNLEELARTARRLVESLETAQTDLRLHRGRLSRNLEALAGVDIELQSLRALQNRLYRLREQLLQRLSAFEPVGRGLGERVRQLVAEIQQRRAHQRSLQEFVSGLSESAHALAGTGRELLTHLGTLRTATVLRSPSREMAEQLSRLHQALERLAQTAGQDGIQALRPETTEIVRRIQESAARVQERLTQNSFHPPPDGPA